MKKLSGLFVLAFAIMFAPLRSELLAQSPASDQVPSLPKCSESVGKVHVHTAVWHPDSKSFLTGITHDKFRFKVYKGGPINFECFSDPDDPYSIGFIIDYSVSMTAGATRIFVEGFREFVKTANDKNTYFGIGFKTRPFLMLAPTNDRREVDDFFMDAEKRGRAGHSSVNDAVQLAIDTMPAQNPSRRIILLASDGQDTSSKKLNEAKMVKALRNAHIRVFVVSVVRNNELIFLDTTGGWDRLRDYTERTDGGWVSGTFETGLTSQLTRLSHRLRAEYTIGFTPAKVEEKWHELEYSVKVPEEFRRISPIGAEGFYY